MVVIIIFGEVAQLLLIYGVVNDIIPKTCLCTYLFVIKCYNTKRTVLIHAISQFSFVELVYHINYG